MTTKTYIEKLRDGEKGVHTLTNQMNNVHYAILELDERLTALERNHKVLFNATKNVTGELGRDLLELTRSTAEALQDDVAPKVANELESKTIELSERVLHYIKMLVREDIKCKTFGDHALHAELWKFVQAKTNNEK